MNAALNLSNFILKLAQCLQEYFKTTGLRLKLLKNRAFFLVALNVARCCKPFRFERPKLAFVFHYFAFFLAVVGFCTVIVQRDVKHIEPLYWATASFAAIGFLVESISIVLKIMRQIWAKSLGKLLYGVSAICAGVIATALINHLVFDLTKVTPENFPNFVKLASILCTAYVFLTFLQIGIALWAVIRYATANLFMLGSSLMIMLLSPFNVKNKDKFLTFIWRLVSGNRSKFSTFKYMVLSTSHVIGAMAVAYALTLPSKWIYNNMHHINHIATMALVEMEYYDGRPCSEFLTSQKFAFLKDGYVSIALKASSGYSFSQTKCSPI